MLSLFITANRFLSKKLDEIIPRHYSIDGNWHFKNFVLSRFPFFGATIYDVGGGKNPAISGQVKSKLMINLIGIDIDRMELNLAPKDGYSRTVCADISKFEGNADGDIVICQTLLEHVENIEYAMRGLSSSLRKGGMALIFVPSRYAIFARINLLLPEKLKKFILYHIYPESRRDQGFRSYYNKCSPREISRIGLKYGLVTKIIIPYTMSSYFSFCMPIYFIWRIWTIICKKMLGIQGSETFTIILKKK